MQGMGQLTQWAEPMHFLWPRSWCLTSNLGSWGNPHAGMKVVTPFHRGGKAKTCPGPHIAVSDRPSEEGRRAHLGGRSPVMYVGRNQHMDLLSPHGGHTLDSPFNIPSRSESASPHRSLLGEQAQGGGQVLPRATQVKCPSQWGDRPGPNQGLW